MKNLKLIEKKKMTLLLLDNHFTQTWLSSDFLTPLSQRFDLIVATPLNIEYSLDFDTDNINFHYFTRSWSTRTQRVLFDLNWVGNRSKSSSFSFWLQRDILGNEYWNFRDFSYLLSKLKEIAIRSAKNPAIFLAFIPPVRFILFSLMKCLEHFENRTKDYLPEDTDIVVIPSQGGAEWDLPEIIRNCSRKKIVSVLAVDNWDNLTSKQVLRFKPDFVTVMGPRAVDQAIEIHGLRKASVLPIGLPRFDTYRKPSKSVSLSKLESECFRINYLGFSLPHDEISVINKLVSDLENYKNPPIEISYRPHPARKNRRVEAIPDGKIVILQRPTSDHSQYVIPNPKEYADEVMGYDLVVASPTTMAIEIMALGKPCIIDATQDGIHRTSAGKAFEHYTHMQDLTTVPELHIARTYEELLEFVIKFYTNRPARMNYQIDHLVNLQKKTYIEQLIDSLSQ